jgi:gamma-glutamyltranspeptidase / glutathione hydrolase
MLHKRATLLAVGSGLLVAFVFIWVQFGRYHAPGAQLPSAQWTRKELDHYVALQTNSYDIEAKTPLASSANGSEGMVASLVAPLAVHAGVKVLQQGGNAADAALTTSLAQIALTGGAAISYAGIMTAVYYDSASNSVYTLNAAYNTVKDETDPLTIPGLVEHSGRTALVPGFMDGVQALHDRFGKAPFSTLFEPAIWIAEHGVPFNRVFEDWLSQSKTVITRLPETKQIFTKPNQEFYKTGELFRQPALAETLKKVAAQGSSYMYKGDWARHFVNTVQSEGGKMTMEDLTAYHALWTEPLHLHYRDYDVVSLGPPNYGGLLTLNSLKLAEVADLKQYKHYTISPDALYDLIQIGRAANAYVLNSEDRRSRLFPFLGHPAESLLSEDAARQVVAYIREETKPISVVIAPGSQHSSGVIAVDAQGNVASILHTINTELWGTTGIFIDGISIPDSAAIQQREIAQAGPGKRLPEGTNPLIVIKRGKPFLASSAVGSALHDVTLQNLINVLDFGMDVSGAVVQPNTEGPSRTSRDAEAVETGFSDSVLNGVRTRGQRIQVIPDYQQNGYWVGVQINPLLSHKLTGAASRKLPSFVEGY